MKINDYRQSFNKGQIKKADYIANMYEYWHKYLFDYADDLKNINISSIEITDEEVFITTKDRLLKFCAIKKDRRVVPFTIINFNDFEKVETDMVFKLLGDKPTVLDIGANIGWYSINIASSLKNSKIFSFEPIQTTFNYLKQNIRVNNLKNIHPYNFGMSDKKDNISFYFYPEGSGNSSMVNVSERQNIELIDCQLSTIDNFCFEKNINIDFIKCDVEGAEYKAIIGGMKTLKRDFPILFIEILRKWAKKFEYDPNKLFKLLKNIGYIPFVIRKNKLFRFEFMDEKTLETNFFFLHCEKHKNLIKNIEIFE